jgi:hypothetical protein
MSVIDGSDRSLKQALEAIIQRFDFNEKTISERFEASESLNRQRFDAVNQRFTAAEKLAEVRHDILLTAIQAGNAASDAKIDSLVKDLSLAHRMELLETKMAAQSKPTTSSEQ